ncbi:hypothetical protein ABK905_12965 [Acerihabitans sp. KWT182]|uniref:Uncharacterized protein n=1 Tax=Acerihabitans sp. KWT182 TaxID=3157919 RepID=A0AAU7QF57_9GAMM
MRLNAIANGVQPGQSNPHLRQQTPLHESFTSLLAKLKKVGAVTHNETLQKFIYFSDHNIENIKTSLQDTNNAPRIKELIWRAWTSCLSTHQGIDDDKSASALKKLQAALEKRVGNRCSQQSIITNFMNMTEDAKFLFNSVIDAKDYLKKSVKDKKNEALAEVIYKINNYKNRSQKPGVEIIATNPSKHPEIPIYRHELTSSVQNTQPLGQDILEKHKIKVQNELVEIGADAFNKIDYFTENALSKIRRSNHYAYSKSQTDDAIEWMNFTFTLASQKMKISLERLDNDIARDLNQAGDKIRQEHLASGDFNQHCSTPHATES